MILLWRLPLPPLRSDAADRRTVQGGYALVVETFDQKVDAERAVGHRGDADEQRLDLAPSGTGLACLLKDKINQLSSGVGVRVVRKMPHRSKKISPSIAGSVSLAQVGLRTRA